MTAPRQFFHLAGQVWMRGPSFEGLPPTVILLDDATQVEILDDLKVLQDAARAVGARDLRVETMRRAYQLQYARLVSKLPASEARAA